MAPGGEAQEHARGDTEELARLCRTIVSGNAEGRWAVDGNGNDVIVNARDRNVIASNTACLAHLAFITYDASAIASTINTTVGHAFGEERITAVMSIQEIISQISAGQNINDALCTQESGTTITIVHMLSQG